MLPQTSLEWVLALIGVLMVANVLLLARFVRTATVVYGPAIRRQIRERRGGAFSRRAP